jgi:hypothetical protein
VFRSLLIGFLILSALTSKGVGVQINQDIAISADMLLDFYNAAVAYAEKQADFVDAKKDSAFLCNTNETAIAIQKIFQTVRHESQTTWAMPDIQENCLYGQFKTSEQCMILSCKGEIFSCGSDTSPPYSSKKSNF